jgi:hypothetical protein
MEVVEPAFACYAGDSIVRTGGVTRQRRCQSKHHQEDPQGVRMTGQ